MYLYGAGGHAKVIRDILEACGLTLSGISDDNPELQQWMEYEVTHELNTDEEVIVCVGKAEHRKTIAKRLQHQGHRFGTAIHPTAVVSPYASIGEGTVVMAGAVINSGARIDGIVLSIAERWWNTNVWWMTMYIFHPIRHFVED